MPEGGKAGGAGGSHQSRQAEPVGHRAHLLVGDLLGLRQGVIDGLDHQVLEERDILGVDGVGEDLDGLDGLVAAGDDLDGTATGLGFDGTGGEGGLHGFHLLLDPLRLAHEFSDAGHDLGARVCPGMRRDQARRSGMGCRPKGASTGEV
jgi:hypothetical protein